jgi:uncharacterized membrane protein YeaQ/YmgE (transglycosylase-associated protein family)
MVTRREEYARKQSIATRLIMRLVNSLQGLPMLHVIWYIILGFIAGLIARLILHTHMDILYTILLGIAGSIVGGLIARLFSRPRDGALFHPAGLILSIIGALIVLYVFNKIGPQYHWNQLLH